MSVPATVPKKAADPGVIRAPSARQAHNDCPRGQGKYLLKEVGLLPRP